jgi:RNA polymerase sigma-70 factor (ECF subfamily)
VALNLATDMLRDRKRRRGLAERVAAAEAATARDVDSYWDERFWHHVSDLPERQRNVVVLHYVHDLAVDSIGEILEVPAGTIKSDLSRARARLRALMEEES